MRETVEYLFGAASFVPHGFCLLWRPDLVAMHALSDAVIAASYFSIPMALAVFVRRRMDLEYKWVFWLFVAFIVACGTTHLVDVVTLWQPAYGLQGLIKIATAGLSVTTAFLLWPLIPKALALPSPSALRKANAELEKALIEKDRALRQISALLDSAPDATLFVNRIGTIVRTNRQTERLLGYSASELINEPVGMLLQEPCSRHLFSERATGLTGTEPQPFATTKDGRKIPVEISRSPIDTDTDYVVCVALRDVTERKHAEDALRQRKAELDEAQRVGRIGSWHWDAETDVVVASDELLRIFGLDPAKDRVPTLGDQRGRWYPDADWKRMKAAVHRTMQTGVGSELDLQAFRNGTPVWVTARGEVVRNSKGEIVGLRGTIQDITERKQAEQTLAERNAQLELAGRAALVGSYVYHVKKGTTQFSQGYAAIHGLPEGTTETTISEWRARVHPEDLARVERLREQAFADRRREDNAEYRIVLSNGEARWIERRGSISYEETGRPERVIGVNIDVTERKRAEQALVEHNILLALAGRAARVGTFAYDTDKEILQISEDYAAIHGLPEGTAKIVRSEWLACVHPQDVEQVELPRSEAFREQQNEYSTDFRIIRPGGEVRWVEIRCFITYDGNGNPRRVVGVSTDVTDRKQAEHALSERNLQLALAEQAALVGSYAYGADLEIMKISEGYCAMHGLLEGTTETTRSQWRARVHSDDLARIEALRTQTLADRRREYNVDYRIVRGGEVRWIEARSFISYDSNGRPYQIVGVNIDVTDRKSAEAALQASEAKFAGILAIAGDAIISIDANHRITLFNEVAEGLFGYSRAEVLGQPIDLLIPARFHAAHQRYLKRFALGPRTSRRMGEHKEVVGRRKNGEEFPGETSISVRDIGGKRFFTAVLRDITERKQAEHALAVRNLQLALAGRAGLVATFAYDFKTERVQVSEGYAAIYGFPEGTTEIARSQLLALVLPDDLERLESVRRQAFADRQREYGLEYRIVVPDRGLRWIETRSFISYDGNGCPQRVAGVNIDITERKRAEDARKILNAELDHRVKNALATVSAVISHTRQGSRSVGAFVDALEGRIRSMAATHELLSTRLWQGISLTELVRRELAPYAVRNNTEVSGPEVVLRAEAGQAMAMVLHELATNAAKYGALSSKDGRVSIRWDRRMNGQPQSSLVLEWQEMDGPPVVATGKPSYGTSTICDLIPYEFGGTVDLVPAPDGVRCRLELPADWLINDGEPASRAITHANDSPEITDLRQVALKALRRNAKSYPNETRGPLPNPIAPTRLRVRRHKTREFAKKMSDHAETKRVLLTQVPSAAPSPEAREHIESALRAVESHIVNGEHRLFEHGKLLEKLKDRSDLILAHQLQMNLETGLHLMHSTRARLLRDLQQG